MAAKPRQKRIAAAAWARRLGAFALMLLLIGGGAHRYALLETVPFLWLLALIGLIATVGAAVAAFALVRIWQRGYLGGRDAIAGAVFAAAALVPFAVAGVRAAVYPPLNDIATDPSDPPRFLTATERRSGPMNPIRPISPEDAEAQADAFPDLSGRRFAAPLDAVAAAIDRLVADRGWTVTARDGQPDEDTEMLIEAEAGTYLLRFPCDVAFRLVADGDETYVDMRSASRYGRIDFGDNALRIGHFLADLETALKTPEGG